MKIELLHIQQGDAEKEFDTKTEKGRKEAKAAIENLLKRGTALFLERGKKTYRVKGYDEATDSLVITVEKKGKEKDTKASGKKGKVAAVPPIRGGVDITAEQALSAMTPTPSPAETEASVRQALADVPPRLREQIVAESLLRRDVHELLHMMVEDMAQGRESISWAEFTTMIDDIAQAHGVEGGLPMPAGDSQVDHPLVLARNAPLGIVGAAYTPPPTEQGAELQRRLRRNLRNSWDQLGDCSISIFDTTEGPMHIKEPMAGRRLRKLMADIGVRSDVPTMTAEAELSAMESLKSRIGPNQYRTYVLSGAFVEKSHRSDVFYLFRKGRPTLAMSFHGHNDGRVLAAMCFHPVGYYEYSHVGVMTPTDEVIAALLMMRGDEHKFWAKSGQWAASDPRSGL